MVIGRVSNTGIGWVWLLANYDGKYSVERGMYSQILKLSILLPRSMGDC